MWKWLEQYFTFTKGERTAIIALVFLIIAVLLLPKVYFYFKPVEREDDGKYDKDVQAFIAAHPPKHEIAELDKDTTQIAQKPVIPATSIHKKEWKKSETYFDFDPNKIGVEDWIKLGFTEKQAITIEHYKEKGGKFYRPDDLKKLYVMTPEHFEKLVPYCKIDVSALPSKRAYRKS
jgi:competence protein ComEA